jgi:hypothetical protein
VANLCYLHVKRRQVMLYMSAAGRALSMVKPVQPKVNVTQRPCAEKLSKLRSNVAICHQVDTPHLHRHFLLNSTDAFFGTMCCCRLMLIVGPGLLLDGPTASIVGNYWVDHLQDKCQFCFRKTHSRLGYGQVDRKMISGKFRSEGNVCHLRRRGLSGRLI